MSIKSQGTELFIVDPVDNAVIKLACPTGINGLGGPSDRIETTCLDATSKSYEQGLKDPAAINVPFNFDPAQTSHQVLNDLYESGLPTNFMVALSDGTTVPTADSAGDFNAVTTRTNVVFSGYIADLTYDVATNDIVKGTLVIQRSGSATWTYKA